MRMKQSVQVWDLPTRLFHWSLVGLFGVMWYSGEQGGDWLQWHIRAGYAVAALVLFRLIWGVIGSDTSRFSHFIRGPKAIRAYLRGELADHQIPGHNPLGGWMVVLLLVTLLFQLVSGFFSTDVDSYLYDGPFVHLIQSDLSEKITEWHKLSVNFLLIFVAIHVLAVIAYRVVKKKNLVRPMITGNKFIEGEVEPIEFIPSVIGLVAFIVAIGGIYTLVTRL